MDFNNILQADLVGPRYIKNDGKFYSFSLMDVYSHRVFIESQRTKADRQVAHSLLRCWKSIGLPNFLQLDNQLSLKGSNRVLDIFGEKFIVSKNLVYSYVKAVIVTKIRQLQVHLGNELVETFDYPFSTE